MAANPEKWKHFERLVAAIHRAADQGAKVTWNDKINKRQFDVTIRFKRGLYEYLTVIECKDLGNPVPVEKVDAFVTKSRDARADKAVMASTAGFQEGAQEVASKHNMTLIHVTDSAEIDLSMFGAHWGTPTVMPHIRSIELLYADGVRKELPRASNALEYYMGHIRLRCGSEEKTLSEFVHANAQRFFGGEVEEYKDHDVACPPEASVVAPDDGEVPLKTLSAIRVCAGMTMARTIAGPVKFDPYLLMPDAKVRNVATGEEQTFGQGTLAFGISTIFEEGKFYEQPQLASYYHCDRIAADTATLSMVESFQHGMLIQAHIRVTLENAKYYVPISDQGAIDRLRRRLEQLRAKQAKRQR
jgi:hypothetical protein